MSMAKLCKGFVKFSVAMFVICCVWYLSGVRPFERTVKVNKAVLTESGISINFSTTWGNPATAFFCSTTPDKGRHYTESNFIQGLGSLDGLVFNKNGMDVEVSFVDKEKDSYFKDELIDMLKKNDAIYCKLVQITTMNLESEEFVIKTRDIMK
ncbi:hypothetical protein ACFQNF_04890 [Iodobacter arcticus]|uniref:Uncharacterized protein n=1 Tax=Iodobacter arcticus TaxID=590593 RepID=A0ABW2QTY6_9NEIS